MAHASATLSPRDLHHHRSPGERTQTSQCENEATDEAKLVHQFLEREGTQ